MNDQAANPRPIRIAIVAGELSGDLLGGQLIAALRRRWPNATFEGVAGPNMEQQGCRPLHSIDRLSVMGLVEVLRHLPELLRIRADLVQRWLANPPDIFIGVDAPDFNLGLANRLRRQGIPTVHFVSPSVWAWRRYRVRKIARAVDLMLVLLPFEAEFYRQHGVRSRFVGHPFADVIAPRQDLAEARTKLALPRDKPVIGLLPGSRVSEVTRLTQPFLDSARWCAQRDPKIVFAVPCATPRVHQIVARECEAYPELNLHLYEGQARDVMAAADVILVASGTATLEALLVTTPMIVAYRLHPLTFALASRLLRVPYLSLPNLLANDAIVAEFTQHHVNAAVIGPRLMALLEDADARARLSDRLRELGRPLRCGSAQVAAAAIDDYVTTRPDFSQPG